MKKVFLIIGLALLASCNITPKGERLGEKGGEHKVELYSGGKLVNTWTSTGNVVGYASSDKFYFHDKGCDCDVKVTGDVVVTKIK